MNTTEITRALRLAVDGQREQALPILSELAKTTPGDFRVWWAIANLSEARDEVREALRRVILLKPDQAEAYEKLEALDRPTRSQRRKRRPATLPRPANPT